MNYISDGCIIPVNIYYLSENLSYHQQYIYNMGGVAEKVFFKKGVDKFSK